MSRKCINCGSREYLHRHHVVPLAAGGIDSDKNTVDLCRYCHAIVHPWMKKTGQVSLRHTRRHPIDPRYVWIGATVVHYTRIYGGRPQPLCRNIDPDSDLKLVEAGIPKKDKRCKDCKKHIEYRNKATDYEAMHFEEDLDPAIDDRRPDVIQEFYSRVDIEYDTEDIDSDVLKTYFVEAEVPVDLWCDDCDRQFMTAETYVTHGCITT